MKLIYNDVGAVHQQLQLRLPLPRLPRQTLGRRLPTLPLRPEEILLYPPLLP